MNKREDRDEWRSANAAADQYGKWCDAQKRKALSCEGTGEQQAADGYWRRADYFLGQEGKAISRMSFADSRMEQRRQKSLLHRIGCTSTIVIGLTGAVSVFEAIRTVIPMLRRRR